MRDVTRNVDLAMEKCETAFIKRNGTLKKCGPKENGSTRGHRKNENLFLVALCNGCKSQYFCTRWQSGKMSFSSCYLLSFLVFS